MPSHSKYLRRSNTNCHEKQLNQPNGFTFNFQSDSSSLVVNASENYTKTAEKCETAKEVSKTSANQRQATDSKPAFENKSFKYIPSDNSFRFGFHSK